MFKSQQTCHNSYIKECWQSLWLLYQLKLGLHSDILHYTCLLSLFWYVHACEDLVSGNSVLTLSFFIRLTEKCVYSEFMSRVKHFIYVSLSRDTELREKESRGELDGGHSQAWWQESRIHQALIVFSRSHWGATVHKGKLKRYQAGWRVVIVQ